MTAFLFPGQGSQKLGMGQDFYTHDSAVRSYFDRAAALFSGDLLSALFGEDKAALNDTRVAQPALLTVEVAIAQYLKEHGLTPTVCAGHSLGEIPALVAAEALPFEAAVHFTLERARLMSENVPEGGMAAVMGLTPEVIEACLPDSVQIANYNAPNQTIISGTKPGLEQAQTALKEAGAKRVLPLRVSGPFHSQYMQSAAEALRASLTDIPLTTPKYRFVSSVSGREEQAPETIRKLLGDQLTAPVQWTGVMATMQTQVALEVGPGTVLKGLASRIPDTPTVHATGTLTQAQEVLQLPR